MIREEIFNIIEIAESNGDVECKEVIENLMEENGILKYEISIDDMFDSPGYDVYSVTVAWIENDKLELAVGSIGIQ